MLRSKKLLLLRKTGTVRHSENLATNGKRNAAHTLQRHNTENSKQIFPEKELHGHSPNFNIHGSMSDLYITTIGLPFLLQENMRTDYKSLTDTNVEIETEAAQFS
jgi:hypothetical protein